MLQNVCYRTSSATECLYVIPSLDPSLMPHFKSALIACTLGVCLQVSQSASRDASLTVRSSQVSPLSDCAV
jgi:hypothetical protein